MEECGENNYGGLAEIMYEVIKEVEGIELYVCTDFDGVAYLIYPTNLSLAVEEYVR